MIIAEQKLLPAPSSTPLHKSEIPKQAAGKAKEVVSRPRKATPKMLPPPESPKKMIKPIDSAGKPTSPGVSLRPVKRPIKPGTKEPALIGMLAKKDEAATYLNHFKYSKEPIEYAQWVKNNIKRLPLITEGSVSAAEKARYAGMAYAVVDYDKLPACARKLIEYANAYQSPTWLVEGDAIMNIVNNCAKSVGADLPWLKNIAREFKMKHFFLGHANPKTRAGKGLHVFCLSPERIIESTIELGEHGVLQAWWKEPFMIKSKRSTFFPKTWSLTKIIDKKFEAMKNPMRAEFQKGILTIWGKTKEGMEIEFRISKKYGFESVYPVFKKISK